LRGHFFAPIAVLMATPMARSRQPSDKPDVSKLLERLAAAENEFLHQEFLAPALRGGIVRVRIGGVLCRIRIQPTDFAGWGVFRPASHTDANLVRPASLAERRRYLELFPLFRLLVCRRAGNVWFGSAASFGDARIQFEGMAPLELAEEVQLFDCVRARYDGSHFWFDELDSRHDPGTASYLRAALAEQTPPDELHRPGLTAEERAAYELNYWQLVEPAQRLRRQREEEPQESDLVRRRLRESLSHAGAQLVDYLERADSFRVHYTIGGRQYTSSVDKQDLTVQVAGICLSGEDQKFDLSSLIGVLREGDQHGEVLRIGDDGMEEQEYWRVHPRRNP
jgi:hypothetical protein